MLLISLLSLGIRKQHKIFNNRKPLKKLSKKIKKEMLQMFNKFMIMICKANLLWKLKNSLVILLQNIHLKSKYQKVQLKNKRKSKLPRKKQKLIKKMSKKSCRQNLFLEKVKLLKKKKKWINNKKKKSKSNKNNNKNQFNKSKEKLSHLKEFYL